MAEAAAMAAALRGAEDATVVVRPLPMMGLAETTDGTKGGEPDDGG